MLAVPNRAMAQSECGTGTTVVCGVASNPYPNGITYTGTAGLNLSFSTGVTVNTSTASGVTVQNNTVDPVTIDTTSGSITTSNDNNYGINASTNGGLLTINSGPITTSGNNAIGINAANSSGSITINSTGGTINTRGSESYGIYASTAGGTLTITSGSIATTGNDAYGINVNNTAPTIATIIDTRAGTITTQGVVAYGLYVSAADGSIDIKTANVSTTGGSAVGLYIINYSTTATTTIDTTAGTISTGGDYATAIGGGGNGGAVSIFSGNVNTSGYGSTGIGFSNSGDLLIDTTAGLISTSGTYSTGVFGYAADGALRIITGNVRTTGDGSQGVYGYAYGASGSMLIDTTAGTVETAGQAAPAVSAFGDTATPVTIRTANINTTGSDSAGLYASFYQFNAGVPSASASIDTTRGRITTQGDRSAGIAVAAPTGDPFAITIRTGDVVTFGNNSHGVDTTDGGLINIDTTGGTISTGGVDAHGIFNFSVTPATDVNIVSGAINISGNGSFGIASALLSHTETQWVCDPTGNCTPVTSPPTPAGPITITAQGPIIATGDGGGGIVALSQAPIGTASGAINITANANITATGRTSVGIAAASSAGPVNVTVGSGVSVMGGWSATPGELSPYFTVDPNFEAPGYIGSNLPAAGIVVYSGATGVTPAMTITNNGFISALNDQAIAMGYTCASENGPATGTPCAANMPPIQKLQVINNNTVTGFVTFLPSAPHQFDNTGTFDVRHFADTDGDGVRDTKRVSISDFGGPGASFNNYGTVRMAPVANPPIVDATNYYVPTTGNDNRPLDPGTYDLMRQGVVQGQFVDLATFNNSGIIDLRGSAVGNSLVITGNPAAGGAPGNGIFVSNGGQLLLNAVLNAGMAPGGSTGSQADMLIVDSTQAGSAPTRISVFNVGGAGALTPGNGIELVEVRNKAQSAPGVFVLQGQYTTPTGQPAVVGGAYAYTLFQNGVGADGADGNWYLRSQLINTPGPAPGPVAPLFQPGVPLYEAYPQLLLGMMDPGTLEQRVGQRYFGDPAVAPAPAQTIFCKDPAQNFRCTLTPQQSAYYLDGQARPIVSTAPSNIGWARVLGGYDRLRPSFSPSGTSWTDGRWGVEAGIDALVHQNAQGDRLFGGLLVNYGGLRANINSPHGIGHIDLNGFGFGATLTWMQQNGFYVDLQARSNFYGGSLNSQTAQRTMIGNNRAMGYAFSAETGRRIAMSANWSLTPQAQLTYAKITFNNFIDPFGAPVSLDRAQSLQGRLGLATDYNRSWKDAFGRTANWKLYGIANLYYEFLNAPQVDVAGVKFSNRLDRLWAGTGVGTTYSWDDDKYALFGEVSVRTSLQHFGKSFMLAGRAGFRARF